MIDHIQEENRLLKERLGGQRIRFTDAERRRLARKAFALGRKALNELETLVTPDTVFRYRNSVSNAASKTMPRVNSCMNAIAEKAPDFLRMEVFSRSA